MRRRPSLWLRISAALTALFAVLHGIGSPWTPSHDLAAAAVVAGMRAVHFNAAGLQRSYWEFYQGFGFSISVLLAVQAVLLWQLATFANATGHYRGMAFAHLAGMLGIAALTARYVFPLPVLFSLAIAACIAIALLSAAPRKESAQA